MTGKTIARYEIQSEIGRGGMAAVYLAYDPNFRRNVAVKLISGNMQENLVFRERFEREAHLIAKIEHPAIVPVYDYGEQDEQLYLVMRYMPGGALTDKIKQGVLTLGDATQIISQIAPALDAVHSQGIVHRDLKPGNILLDSFGNPAIADFGIAHLSVATTNLTGSAVIGTPSYMSPEQVRGDADLDGRSDVYALGVILFEMLTGRGPFQANTPMSVALKHLTEPLPSIRSFRPDLPMELEPILNKALAKDRKARYTNASELARDLRAIPDTFSENNKHQPIPVILSHGEEVSTEMDMGDDSIPAIHASSAPEHNVSRSTPQPSGAISQSSIPATRLKRPPRILQIAVFAGVAFILFIFCSSIGLFGAWAAALGLPSLFPGQNPTVSPTLTATQEIVLFEDDFSDPTSGWPIQEGYSYQQDGYHISVDEMGGVPWASTNREDSDVSIHVDAKPVTEGMNSYYGLLCRIQDNQNFYYFVIRSNGDYTIGKYKNAEFVPFFDWRRSDAIKQGNQTNRLKAECAGDTLRLYANNVVLGEVTDTDFTSGFSGILVGSPDTQGFEVVFDNFLITRADQ